MNLNNPYKETTVLQRITVLMNTYNISRRKLASMIDVPPTTINSLYQRKSIPSSSLIQAILKAFPQIAPEWLISGEGDIYKISLLSLMQSSTESKEMTVPPKKVASSNDTRPRIPYTAAAGSLTSAVDGITEADCEQIPFIAAFPDYDYTMIVKGDSMYPNYEGGDEVACKRIDSTSFIQWGKVHVLDTAQGIVIKRVYDADGNIRCSSYNKEYPDFTINKEEIYSMSLVVGMLRL